VELQRNWSKGSLPVISLAPKGPKLTALEPAPSLVAARALGYVLTAPGTMAFVLPLEHGCPIDPARDRLYVAGDFNGWQAAVGAEAWELKPAKLNGEKVLMWTGPAQKYLADPPVRFKFVTGEHIWLSPPNDAPNVVRDANGTSNQFVDPARTGDHYWRFTASQPLDLSQPWVVSMAGGPLVRLAPGRFFFQLHTDLPLGATVESDRTVFRLFAPRARAVTLHVQSDLGAPDRATTETLVRRADTAQDAGVWEVTVMRNLHGHFYWYTLEGMAGAATPLDPKQAVLDPYALATVDRGGPGIVLERSWVGWADRSFPTPPWQDLVIVEAHVRDLAGQAPVDATRLERRGFTGLRKWVESPEFYLHELGVNCVELQPIQEFDNRTPEEYHWGYMTNNYFAPESSYALAPESASGLREFRDLVSAFHRRGMAVILDVVCNHVGEPAHLLAIDRLYYFEQGPDGQLTNWSGCGNDLRASSAMAKKLIIDSCRHLIEAFGIDGFRFDLAELLGVEVLRDIEAALKQAKPDVILISEPWSFRGHIAGALRDTGWASWNDGYRDFVREYVLGRGAGERLEYFLRGSPWYFAKWPAQTVNYTQSHDDKAWIDLITENADGDGFLPTANDRRRTHLMAAVLFMSVGIPMLASGQDFFHSKHGVSNTYQRGDLNALDYRRMYRYLGTHSYFADWIAFRRGPQGTLLRHFSRPSEGFFQFFRTSASPAVAALYNADRSQGATRVLFAINPSLQDVTLTIPVSVSMLGPWRQLADHDRFYERKVAGGLHSAAGELLVPALSCGLWVCEV
jgi:pullulanase/glycogen debranching enzyme